jgi:aminopeptidase N
VRVIRTRRAQAAVAGLTAALLALGGCTADTSRLRERLAGSFAPGAADVGDPYLPGYGNGGYDVAGYALRLRYDPATDTLSGTATVTATATADLSRFNLDLSGLTVESVRVDGAAARHTRDAAELVVTPARGLARGTRFTVEVAYRGVPAPIVSPGLGAAGFAATGDGAIALGEPESASTWFPVNDHPRDKATYDLQLTVPDGLAALSNGVPGPRRGSGGWTTWTWTENTPMASYLAFVVIGRYQVSTGTHAGRPVVTAVPEGSPVAGPGGASVARTGEIADFLAGLFGPYPFDSYGGIVVDDPRIGYALETQSRPVYGPAFFAGGPDASVVAHELAHQWFGDSVSVTRWSDIWLNEGFASYAEWLWEEHSGGRKVGENFDQTYAATDWSRPALDPGRADLFGRAVYKRGALVVHALRLTIGDEAFFRLLKTWTAERRGGNATTADLVATAERVSGRPLGPFFSAWLSGTTAPVVPGR